MSAIYQHKGQKMGSNVAYIGLNLQLYKFTMTLYICSRPGREEFGWQSQSPYNPETFPFPISSVGDGKG